MADLPADNIDFNTALATINTLLAPGKVFISSEYESAKSTLLNVAQDLGYFDLDFSESRVAVSRKAKTANITLTAIAGVRYTFGDTLFQQREFSDTFMRRWTPIEQGDPYKAELIGELTQNLQNSGYFSSVRVRPLVDPRYGTTVPIAVDLTLKEKNQVALGIGFSTDTDFRTKLSWDKPLLNRFGHSLNGGFSLAREIQSASFAYRIPRDTQPLYNYWGIEYGVRNDTSNDTDSFLGTLSFQRVTRTPKGWTESLFLRYEREVFEVSDVEATTDLILPGFSYSRVRSKGTPFPVWGQSISFELMGGAQALLSTIDFIKVAGRFRYLRALSDRNTIIATAQYGAISASNNDLIPVSQRFFAGGDRTIRGFAFRTVSPVDEDGDEIGGRFLEVLNLEYNYRFADLWSGALFADGGRAFNSFSTGYSVGAGFGIRWQSPVGPFRVDIATPVRGGESGDIRLHLSLGADF